MRKGEREKGVCKLHGVHEDTLFGWTLFVKAGGVEVGKSSC